MFRPAIALIIAALSTQAFADSDPVFRPTVLVSGAVVRIGDLIDNAPAEKAQIAVFRAPDLGNTGNVSILRVMEALRPHNLVDVDAAGLSEIAVTRASRVVTSKEIKSRIADLLAERLRVSDPSHVGVTLDNSPSAIHLEASNKAPLDPMRLNLDPRNGRFDIVFRTDGAPLRVTGLATETYDAVVAARPIGRGELLREGDVTIEKRPKQEIQGDSLRDAANAVGLELRQAMRPGQVIRSGDLSKPQLVKRGEPVMLLYEVPGIVLTARGKAEESASLGDVVNVTNIQSKRIIQGIVTGPGQVKVTSLTPRISHVQTNLAAVQDGVSRP